MPGEQQTEEEEEEEMQEEMVLLVKGEEDEGEEKYEVVKLKIPMDNKEVRVPPLGAWSPLNLVRPSLPRRNQRSSPYFPLSLRRGISGLVAHPSPLLSIMPSHRCHTYCASCPWFPVELDV